jgi:prefoldin alpha subunit
VTALGNLPAMSSSNTNNSNNTVLPLDAMSLEQLDQLKQGEEQRLQALAQRFAALRQAAARLTAATLAVQELEKTTESEVFVPLTESVYVPGKIRGGKDPLLIELGTGYFVEQTPQGTVDFFQRKLRLVDANSENGTIVKSIVIDLFKCQYQTHFCSSIVTQAVQATKQNLESIAIAMRGKLIEIQARQQGQRTRAAAENT